MRGESTTGCVDGDPSWLGGVLLCAGEGADLVVLEDHVRLTAYALAPEAVPPELTAILRTSLEIVHWELY